LVRSCPKLKDLNLKGNPIANQRTYRVQIFTTLVNLDTLDGLHQQKADKNQTKKELDLSMDMIDSAVQQGKKLQVSSQNKSELASGW
jgi:hypothetical protein